MAFYEKYVPQIIRQDFGHTGIFHDVVENEKHLGMFAFNVGNNLFCHFDVLLRVESLLLQFEDQSCFLGTFTFGTFEHPEFVPYYTFIDETSLDRCGFNPIQTVPCTNGDIVDSVITLSYHLLLAPKFCGILFEPADLHDTNHFSLLFNAEKSFIKCWGVNAQSNLSDLGSGWDINLDTNHPVQLPDVAFARDHAKPTVLFKEMDAGGLSDEFPTRIRLFAEDYSQNYSLLIHHINLTEDGHIGELYGFNCDMERYYSDSSKPFEKSQITRYNFVTWSGLLVEWPWCALLWWGEVYLFADQEEFGLCCRTHFKEHGDDVCPVCGNPLGNQWKYSFIDVMRVPHQIWFCSKSCLREFNKKLEFNLKMLTKPSDFDSGL